MQQVYKRLTEKQHVPSPNLVILTNTLGVGGLGFSHVSDGAGEVYVMLCLLTESGDQDLTSVSWWKMCLVRQKELLDSGSWQKPIFARTEAWRARPLPSHQKG